MILANKKWRKKKEKERKTLPRFSFVCISPKNLCVCVGIVEKYRRVLSRDPLVF